ncbi:ligase-associated DNA damage response endonuclease PdeM [Agriterribacter sp.]|uniref:ligase-associated DNA damage response endonuclease PdeM n=1 Tax=Agriterribacter sp. TaxID=2821509 RepID=UPI002CE78EBB|nr:ligase-associated DNA damage response endonuclease PdeM [Agriterribacter sp.]HTN05433.1 ligase-associated DNA damage response endonuclease PdeM [Agriterribacter sp.]
MHPPLKHIVSGQTLWLCAERCIYWEAQRSLILADLHIGKTGHFRKAGIGVPQTVFKDDMQRLVSTIQFFKPEQLIIVGDMFHSESNKELELFSRWRKDFSSLSIQLIKGNHDILQDQWYKATAIDLHTDALATEHFIFRHNYSISPGESSDKYFFSGHIHPGVYIKGMARQSLRLPCFHFTAHYCTLPAFSRFTGLATVVPEKQDKVFAIVNDRVMLI